MQIGKYKDVKGTYEKSNITYLFWNSYKCRLANIKTSKAHMKKVILLTYFGIRKNSNW